MVRARADRRSFVVVGVLVLALAISLAVGFALVGTQHAPSPSTVPARVGGPGLAVTTPTTGVRVDLSDPAIDAAPSSQRPAFAEVAATSRAYFRGMDVAMHSGDVSLFSGVSDPRCKCREFGTTMLAIYSGGGISGGGISVTKMRVLDVSGRTSGVTVDYLMQAHSVTHQGKTTLYPGYLIHASLFVWREDDGTWKVGDLTRLAEDPLGGGAQKAYVRPTAGATTTHPTVVLGALSAPHLMLACVQDPACAGGHHTGDDISAHDVNGDQGDGAIVGTGGLILPGSGYDGDPDARRTAATCDDCRWRLQPRCLYNNGADDDAMCGASAATCPAGQLRYRVFLYTAEDPEYREVGSVCIGADGVTTTAELSARVRDAFIDLLPKPNPSYQPKGGDIVNLPAVFDSGQPSVFGPRTFALLGEQVEVTARATWSWRFGDGGSLDTASPGGAWPDTSVSHVYRIASTHSVDLTTTWTGDYTVDGLGPLPVGGDPITQQAELRVPVRDAHTVLVSGE